jgi:hypothetical protein
VRSQPAGVDCPSTCAAAFDPTVTVRLVATAAAGARFLGWTGACAGAAACVVRMDAAKSVQARFGPSTYRLGISVNGSGRVLGGTGIACATRCAYRVAADAVVRLRPRPAAGWRFVGWTGSCHGRAGTCALRVSVSKSVRATFRRAR